MDFWSSAAGQNLGEIMNMFFRKNVYKKQYTKVVNNECLGSFVEAEIENGSTFVGVVPYDEAKTLVIMEK